MAWCSPKNYPADSIRTLSPNGLGLWGTYQRCSYLKVSKQEWNTLALPQDPSIIYADWAQENQSFAEYLKVAFFKVLSGDHWETPRFHQRVCGIKTVFIIIPKQYLPFSLSILQECEVEFSRGYMTSQQSKSRSRYKNPEVFYSTIP